jgi:hypothetical protein
LFCFFSAVFISCITKTRPGYWFRLVSGFVCVTEGSRILCGLFDLENRNNN